MRVSEISAMVKVPISTLRYYEKRGILKPGRDGNGYRDYSEKDVAWIQFVQRLIATGMSLAHIEEFSRMRHQGDATVGQRLTMLTQHHDRLMRQSRELNEQIDYLEHKIIHYQHQAKSQE
ncbi:MerR family transcriptional regulator [Bifidobacterium aquikefiricola]|uniref:MerR family transcriptional regulator n=1 Tax=Bifidobacterium aquikefiricola TaxID=3059038 RepID=A0AB39U6E8_9BIFI